MQAHDDHPNVVVARSGWRRPNLWMVAALALASSGVLGACAPPPPPNGPIVGIYGDSISYQASPWSDAAVAAAGGQVTGLRFPGLAACDLVEPVLDDLDDPPAYRPDVVVISTVGNSLSPCMNGSDGRLAPFGSSEFWELYRAALTRIADAAAEAGVPMVFTWGPSSSPFLGSWSGGQHLGLLAQEIADDHPHMVIAHVGAVVLDQDDRYQVYLPCAADESASTGCADGRVHIRVSAQNGHFFCAESEVLPNGWPRTCPMTSPGARRYGMELARVALGTLAGGWS